MTAALNGVWLSSETGRVASDDSRRMPVRCVAEGRGSKLPAKTFLDNFQSICRLACQSFREFNRGTVMKRFAWIAGITVVAGCLGVLYLRQKTANHQLARDNADLQTRLAAATQQAAVPVTEMKRPSTPAAGPQERRLSEDQFHELLRLRGEVTLLREKVATQDKALEMAQLQNAVTGPTAPVSGMALGTRSLTLMEVATEYSAASPKVPPVVPSNGRVQWHHDQATGAPDTASAGDRPTAWAPRSAQSGTHWLALGYDRAVEIGEINIHETYHPGAISKVAAMMPDGSLQVLWEGAMEPGANDIQVTSLPVPRGTTADQIVVYLDTNRVASWPEIDAVELVGVNGSRQWASRSSASSSYSETYGVPVR